MKLQIVGETLYEHQNLKILKFGEEAGILLAEAIEKDHKNRENINEEIALLTISALLAAPALVKIIGYLIKKASKLIKWKEGEKRGKQLQEFAHKTEKKIQQPLNWILKKLGVKDDEKREKWTKGIFALIIILLGMYSGLEAVHAYKAANIGKSSAEGLLTALKASETGETLMATITSAGKVATKV